MCPFLSYSLVCYRREGHYGCRHAATVFFLCLRICTAEHLLDLVGEGQLGEGFQYQFHARVEAALMDDCVAGISGGEKDFQLRIAFDGGIRKLASVQLARESNVGE